MTAIITASNAIHTVATLGVQVISRAKATKTTPATPKAIVFRGTKEDAQTFIARRYNEGSVSPTESLIIREDTPENATITPVAEPVVEPAPKTKKTPKSKPVTTVPEKEKTPMATATAPAPKTKAPKAKATPEKNGKAPAKTTPVVERGTPGGKKKDGLRAAQVRILGFLAKSGKFHPRKEIAAGAPCDVANCVELLGSHDPAKRAANDAKHFPSLISLGFVKVEESEDEGVRYVITASGRKAHEKATK